MATRYAPVFRGARDYVRLKNRLTLFVVLVACLMASSSAYSTIDRSSRGSLPGEIATEREGAPNRDESSSRHSPSGRDGADESSDHLVHSSGPRACSVQLQGLVGAIESPATTNTYELWGTVSFSSPPASGELFIRVEGGPSKVFSAPFTSPLAIQVEGLYADGASARGNGRPSPPIQPARTALPSMRRSVPG